MTAKGFKKFIVLNNAYVRVDRYFARFIHDGSGDGFTIEPDEDDDLSVCTISLPLSIGAYEINFDEDNMPYIMIPNRFLTKMTDGDHNWIEDG
jgi:hypothetical protein